MPNLKDASKPNLERRIIGRDAFEGGANFVSRLGRLWLAVLLLALGKGSDEKGLSGSPQPQALDPKPLNPKPES